MCGCTKFTETSGKTWTICFPNPKAALPTGDPLEPKWPKWGRRRDEQAEGFLQTGWARIDSIEAGKWDKYQPVLVPLLVQAFMEKDAEKKSHWFAVPPGKAVQGLLATWKDEQRIYVVTEPMPAEYAWLHDRWPRLVDI